ncbi:thioredoxin domain-containing protein [Halioxenophilus aromaticivorans]
MNVLAEQTSPYLRQHKDNPVNWQTWGPKVLQAAVQADKPIFLSIGYSTNHWCKVMANETFCHPHVVNELNEHFICIKVDREERPDLDDIYQTGHQLLCGSAGGWPLSVFLCPHTQMPFVVGTYYPPESNSVQLGFVDLLDRVLNFYHGDREQFKLMIDQVRQGYRELEQPPKFAENVPSQPLQPFKQAVENILNEADRRYGGFGPAPKFALPFKLQRLLSVSRESTGLAQRAHRQCHLTLMMMARGGIRDIVVGGFFRYATDNSWSIPHFEKMLYDNASLLPVYAEASRVMQSSMYAKTARGIAHWMCSEISNGEGAFFSSLDSDNAMGEGAYYCWQTDELRQVLTDRQFEVMTILCKWQGMPNFYGLWHLQLVGRVSEAVEQLDITTEDVQVAYRDGIARLAAERRNRPQPAHDEKILASSNALAVRGLAIAGRLLNDPLMISAALRCVDFITHHLWQDNRLYATWCDGTAGVLGFLDDYAYTMIALLECLEAQWREQDYQLLIQIADTLLALFTDEVEGGALFYTSNEHEVLAHRSKPIIDRVIPAGNGVAAQALARLGYLVASDEYLNAAKAIVEHLWPSVQHQPDLHDSLLRAREELDFPLQVMLTGPDAGQWQAELIARYINRVHCFAVVEEPCDDAPSQIETKALFCVSDAQLQFETLADLTAAIDMALMEQPVTTGDTASQS